MSAIKKSNEYVKESGAEIARIKRLLKKIKFDIEINLIRGHENNIGEYRRNPTKHLIKNCDARARIKRENIEIEESENNIKWYGNYALTRNNVAQIQSTNAVLRMIDAQEEELRYAKKKYGYKVDFIDLEARNTFSVNKVTTSMIKCANGFNYYGLRHAMINNNMIEANCPRCNQVETWDHVVWCSDTVRLRREFITELLLELLAERNEEVSIDNIMAFGEDIVQYLEYEEDEEEYETSQWLIGMKELFRGYVVKV